MSLVFAGSCAAFHNQHFKMSDTLTHEFEQNIYGLNLHATPYASKKEVDKVDGKED